LSAHVEAVTLPLMATRRPSPSSVTVGYQRAKLIFGPAVQALVAGSKIDVLLIPISPSNPCPPAITTRPSGRVACPEQKMSSPKGFVTMLSEPLEGSKSCDGLGATQPSISSSFPLCMRMLCAATKPQSINGDHCPTLSTSGGGGGGGGAPVDA
jgi:hypothetical protein